MPGTKVYIKGKIVRKNIFVASKGEYVKGKRPAVECILCSIMQNDPEVINLEVQRLKREYKKYAEELLDL